MPKDPQNTEAHRSFTVRVPESIYEKIGEMAKDDDVFMNTKVNELLKLGLGKHVSLDAAVARLLKQEVTNND